MSVLYTYLYIHSAYMQINKGRSWWDSFEFIALVSVVIWQYGRAERKTPEIGLPASFQKNCTSSQTSAKWHMEAIACCHRSNTKHGLHQSLIIPCRLAALVLLSGTYNSWWQTSRDTHASVFSLPVNVQVLQLILPSNGLDCAPSARVYEQLLVLYPISIWQNDTHTFCLVPCPLNII